MIGWSSVGKSTLIHALNAHSESRRGDGSYLHQGRWLSFHDPTFTPNQSLLPGSVPDKLSAILLVYDVCSAPSVNGLFKWWQTSGQTSVPTMLIGTHIDGTRQIPSGVVRIHCVTIAWLISRWRHLLTHTASNLLRYPPYRATVWRT